MRRAAIVAPLRTGVGAFGGTLHVNEGYAQLDYPMMFAGVILVGLLFLASELAFAAVQRRLTRRGIRAPRDQDLARAEARLGA